jgi:hypothetical protein
MSKININEVLEDEFRIWLKEALELVKSDELSNAILRDLVRAIHREGHTKDSYAALGESLYSVAHGVCAEHNEYKQRLFEAFSE